MTSIDWTLLEQFLAQHSRDFSRISRATRGEFSPRDVAGEARLIVVELAGRSAERVDLDAPNFIDGLLRRLYKRLVEFQDKKVRNGVRLDHAPSGHDDVDGWNPIAARLVSDDGFDPLTHLLAAEAQNEQQAGADAAISPAAAWLRLIQHFNQDMLAVARHLLISRSWAYRCVNRAVTLAGRQRSLACVLRDQSLPRPWRNFKLCRVPVQLPLDFGDEVLLPL